MRSHERERGTQECVRHKEPKPRPFAAVNQQFSRWTPSDITRFVNGQFLVRNGDITGEKGVALSRRQRTFLHERIYFWQPGFTQRGSACVLYKKGLTFKLLAFKLFKAKDQVNRTT
jgi:hypothetical protein